MHKMRAAWLNVMHGSNHSYAKAQQYYERQLPLFQEAARNFELHPAFVGLELPWSITFYDMVHARFDLLRSNLEKYRWDDFKIEKDKCVAISFFANNSLAHSRAVGIWSDPDLLLEMLPSVLAKTDEWPMFLKSCHLTAGADNSVFRPPITSLKNLKERTEELKTFVAAKWKLRSNDYERTWSADANAVMNTLHPGFILQTPAKFTMEIKTEVIWGRAYLLMIDGISSAVTRDGEIQYYKPGSWTGDWLNQATDNKDLDWIVEEGHHTKVIAMVEKFAKLVGIDEIRVDVFIRKGHPEEAMFNEDSISSGGQYRSHFNHLAEIWAMGHRDKLYKVKDTPNPAYSTASEVEYSIPHYGGTTDYGKMSPQSKPYPSQKESNFVEN
eukprot:TRINITY_DN3732_c0_g1_i6.p1 TRINITY_DN3732_c0_g1~~TRINITY_DN3732_c0_g1_i6.p1  ORF type:complete len:383 (+),score=70.03 TRINITY_DN3732_c0_g1_i6:1952-3100(+)